MDKLIEIEIPDKELFNKDEHDMNDLDSKNEGGSNVVHNKNHLSCSNTFLSDPVASENEDENENKNKKNDEDESEDQNWDRHVAKLRNEMKRLEKNKESEVQKAYSALEAASKLDETIPIGLLTEVDGNSTSLTIFHITLTKSTLESIFFQINFIMTWKATSKKVGQVRFLQN